jgi:hypothetical protein
MQIDKSHFAGIDCDMNDPETLTFARQIRGVFKRAGWNVGIQVGQAVLTSKYEGVHLEVNEKDKDSPPPGGAREVYMLLNSNGVMMAGGANSNRPPEGKFSIFVGSIPKSESSH